jgi:hypothetical protein
MSNAMTKQFTFLLVVVGCATVAAAPAQAQARQQLAHKTTVPAVSAKIAGAKTKTRVIHHPTASQRFPNPAALTVITMSDGSKRLRRADQKGR